MAQFVCSWRGERLKSPPLTAYCLPLTTAVEAFEAAGQTRSRNHARREINRAQGAFKINALQQHT